MKSLGIKVSCLQGRSGRVALPRTKLVLAMAMGLAARRPALMAGVVRRRAEDMVYDAIPWWALSLREGLGSF